MTSRKPRFGLICTTLCVAILGGVSWAAAAPILPLQPKKLAEWPQGASSPALDLADTEGVPRTLNDYRGQVVVIYFGFMHCPDACPAELFKLALVMKQLGHVAAGVQVLFITLDPERDKPPALKSYVSAFNPRFTALTGTTAKIDQAASRFNVQYARVPLGTDYTIDHSDEIFVFDAAGRLRLIGAANSPVADFVHDIEALAAERPAEAASSAPARH
jgi:protein SCO1/2